MSAWRHGAGRLGRSAERLETLLIGRTCEPPARSLQGWTPESPLAGCPACPRCGSSAGPFEADVDGCSSCRGRRLKWDRAIRLGLYEGPLREQVLAVKYRRWRPSGAYLGRLLGEAIAERFEAEGVDPTRAVVVPVPMSGRRRISRGLDHAALIAGAAARVMEATAVAALQRSHRPRQASLPASQRRRAVARAMRARACPEGLRASSAVVVVDDVRTTGATLTECWRALGEAGWPELGSGRRWSATLAVAESRQGGLG